MCGGVSKPKSVCGFIVDVREDVIIFFRFYATRAGSRSADTFNLARASREVFGNDLAATTARLQILGLQLVK